jgi:hypothetical protein
MVLLSLPAAKWFRRLAVRDTSRVKPFARLQPKADNGSFRGAQMPRLETARFFLREKQAAPTSTQNCHSLEERKRGSLLGGCVFDIGLS